MRGAAPHGPVAQGLDEKLAQAQLSSEETFRIRFPR